MHQALAGSQQRPDASPLCDQSDIKQLKQHNNQIRTIVHEILSVPLKDPKKHGKSKAVTETNTAQ